MYPPPTLVEVVVWSIPSGLQGSLALASLSALSGVGARCRLRLRLGGLVQLRLGFQGGLALWGAVRGPLLQQVGVNDLIVKGRGVLHHRLMHRRERS